jgi:hypothetical protein
MFSTVSYSQGIRKDSLLKNAFYFEAFGNGVLYSFGYDRIIFNKEKYKITSGLGFEVMPADINGGEDALVIPCEINILSGKKNKFLEMGVGVTFAFTDVEYDPFSFASCIRLGYRSVNSKNFFFRAAFTPFFWIEKEYGYDTQAHHEYVINKFHALPWGGVSIGEVF